MDEISQAAVPHASSTSKSTGGLAVAYHFLIAAGLTGLLVIIWVRARSLQEDILIPFSVIVTPLVILYLITGWGILRWKNWSRVLSLILNWINVVAGVVNVARINREGAIGVVLSCLMVWWLSMPAVKLEFRGGSGSR